MSRSRRGVCTVVLAAVAFLPLPGCSSLGGTIGTLAKIAIGVGIAVGTYYLIDQIR